MMEDTDYDIDYASSDGYTPAASKVSRHTQLPPP